MVIIYTFFVFCLLCLMQSKKKGNRVSYITKKKCILPKRMDLKSCFVHHSDTACYLLKCASFLFILRQLKYIEHLFGLGFILILHASLILRNREWNMYKWDVEIYVEYDLNFCFASFVLNHSGNCDGSFCSGKYFYLFIVLFLFSTLSKTLPT